MAMSQPVEDSLPQRTFSSAPLSSFDLDSEAKFDSSWPNDDPQVDDKLCSAQRVISKRAMAAYTKAETRFLDFLASADVWSQDEVRESPADLVAQCCRTLVLQACMCRFSTPKWISLHLRVRNIRVNDRGW